MAFPSTADNAQVCGFQEAFLGLLQDLVKEALASCESLPVSNTVAIAGVLLDDALSGVFSAANLTTALDLTLRIVREISGRYTDRQRATTTGRDWRLTCRHHGGWLGGCGRHAHEQEPAGRPAAAAPGRCRLHRTGEEKEEAIHTNSHQLS